MQFILPVLQVIFITLKVIGLISWPWAVVLWPLWLMLVIVAVCVILAIWAKS